MNFEQWLRRPAYVAQCFTSKLAQTLPEWSEDCCLLLRVKPEFRSAKAVTLRKAVAARVIELRRMGAIDRRSIRETHERILRCRRGQAVRVDMGEKI
jgi:hypothetical protein